MAQRRAVLSPFALVRIGTLAEAVNNPIILKHLPELETGDLIYSCLFQAGVDEFELSVARDEYFPRTSFLRNRTVVHRGSEWVDSFLVVTGVFDQYLGAHHMLKKDKYQLEAMVEVFLIDLLYAMHRGASLVAEIPSHDQISALRPASLALPIRHLISSFEIIKPELLVTSASVTSANVARFEEIINSHLYGEYVEGHAQLEKNTEAPKEMEKLIRDAARRLQRKNDRYLRLENLPVSILPTTARLIDAVFGSLPGKLAEVAANLFSKWLGENRRIVVYELKGPREELLRSRIDEYVRRQHGEQEARE